jgi:DNA primase
LYEKILLALMLNYPPLFNEFGEDLARIGFETPEFEALRSRIMDILSFDSHEPLDATELYRHLCSGTESQPEGLAEILSKETYVHAGFARPDQDFEQARHGWKSIWNKHLREQLQADLQAARRRHAADETDENWTRVMALQNQLLTMEADSQNEGISESA